MFRGPGCGGGWNLDGTAVDLGRVVEASWNLQEGMEVPEGGVEIVFPVILMSLLILKWQG
jgi:hypothetical protein